ncbi:MAG: hypothetical protein M1492_08210 [Gammaproteobacteria bacterium]|jgi:hypothetical protein|uniref:hypothetical protein n=1 Tax=Acidithiobacillus ferrooxidans TaxID=920 RepID=UPI002148799D|nr:hypothetical protein [Acidithiobacillus ferrooxidans]MCL4526463.1 hypothetical protein [Gammaproteobacteria bacterium]MCR1345285.1 hypothetical protein [Acidithiobacillus ferrooxidans]MCR1354445.1 hypothetical protein [Acidithiobacillus ferrooxidans]MDA8376772.1 hypothetical protein [Planctomycetia bacterium]
MRKIQIVLTKGAMEQAFNDVTNNIMILLAQAIFALPLAFMVMIGLVIITLPMVLHGIGQDTYAQIMASIHHHPYPPFGKVADNIAILVRGFFLFSWAIAWFARLIMTYLQWVRKSDTNPGMALRALTSSTIQENPHA